MDVVLKSYCEVNLYRNSFLIRDLHTPSQRLSTSARLSFTRVKIHSSRFLDADMASVQCLLRMSRSSSTSVFFRVCCQPSQPPMNSSSRCLRFTRVSSRVFSNMRQICCRVKYSLDRFLSVKHQLVPVFLVQHIGYLSLFSIWVSTDMRCTTSY